MGEKAWCQEKKENEVNRESELFFFEVAAQRFLCAIGELNRAKRSVLTINRFLTERQGRTGEYWPEVVRIRTEHSEVRKKTTEGQYSPVRPEQARLVSSFLWANLCLHFLPH